MLQYKNNYPKLKTSLKMKSRSLDTQSPSMEGIINKSVTAKRKRLRPKLRLRCSVGLAGKRDWTEDVYPSKEKHMVKSWKKLQQKKRPDLWLWVWATTHEILKIALNLMVNLKNMGNKLGFNGLLAIAAAIYLLSAYIQTPIVAPQKYEMRPLTFQCDVAIWYYSVLFTILIWCQFVSVRV